jgi:hypothetical protein
VLLPALLILVDGSCTLAISRTGVGRTDGVLMSTIQLQSVLTCPKCGHESAATMPTDVCQYLYDCAGCGALLRAAPGDCCVFCSYGTVPCPPVQEARRAGGAAARCGRGSPNQSSTVKPTLITT